MGEPREKNMGGKLLFCFGLVCKGVVKFQK
jgi:hypothetical protein